ncbi:hypothetical protein PR048_004412 [Dryococelus australis]|uniref:Uncharacterized protein n=1 Tax=Dryococelus australis TaxID=614101 RepID=A0ABQ9I5C5_9NEOP|nr:hypothetical protein PR048_004412 [Dryococelus australis]
MRTVWVVKGPHKGPGYPALSFDTLLNNPRQAGRVRRQILRLETRRTRSLSSRHSASKTSRVRGVPFADMSLVFSLWHLGQGDSQFYSGGQKKMSCVRSRKQCIWRRSEPTNIASGVTDKCKNRGIIVGFVLSRLRLLDVSAAAVPSTPLSCSFLRGRPLADVLTVSPASGLATNLALAYVGMVFGVSPYCLLYTVCRNPWHPESPLNVLLGSRELRQRELAASCVEHPVHDSDVAGNNASPDPSRNGERRSRPAIQLSPRGRKADGMVRTSCAQARIASTALSAPLAKAKFEAICREYSTHVTSYLSTPRRRRRHPGPINSEYHCPVCAGGHGACQRKGLMLRAATGKRSLERFYTNPARQAEAPIILRLETRRTRVFSSRHCASKTYRDGCVPFRRLWSSTGIQARRKREIPTKTRKSAESYGMIPKCENPGATPPGNEPGLPRWEAIDRITTSPRSHLIKPLFVDINLGSLIKYQITRIFMSNGLRKHDIRTERVKLV